MPATATEPDDQDARPDVACTGPGCRSWAPWLVAAVAAAAVGAAVRSPWAGAVAGWAVLAVLVYAVALPAWSRVVENGAQPRGPARHHAGVVGLRGRAACRWSRWSPGDRRGRPGASAREFLTFSMRNVVGEGGGIYHAIIGTLLITLAATVISVPVGLMTAIYLVEYGDNGRTARTITFLVDVMTGIPSIVAGLFAYALFVLFFGEGVRMGFGGAVALSLLMIPIVVRSCEEMLKLVPARPARGVVRPGRAEVAHDRQGRAADGAGRHHHRRHAGGRPGDRRDRTRC